MSSVLNFIISLFMNLFELLLVLLLLTVLNYYQLLPDGFYSFLKLMALLCTVFIQSFSLGKKTKKKGYLEGIKYGILLILILFLVTVLFSKWQIRTLLYYLLILSTSTLGSMIGISFKKDTKK